MKITRDVIVDLLPVYESGEASADTRALVEEYLRQDPDLAQVVGGKGLQAEVLPADLPPDLLKNALERTKKMIRLKSRLMTLAVCFTWAAFFVLFWDIERGGKSVRGSFVMLRDRPDVAYPCLVIAVGCWAAYFLVKRRLRTTSL